MTGIEWTDETWNPIVGCSIHTPGCTNCYAMTMAARIERMGAAPHYAGTTQPSKAGPVWTGKLAQAPESILTKPLRWKRPRRIFVNSMGDLFHEDVPDAWIDLVFAVMALAPQHDYQILTKRGGRMRTYINGPWPNQDGVAARIAEATWSLAPRGALPEPPTIFEVPVGPRDAAGNPEFGWRRMMSVRGWPLPNVWLGVSVEDQTRADERREDLRTLAYQGWVTWVSYEPALSAVDWRGWEFIRWLVSGGESGRNARPSHPDCHRRARDWAAANGIAYLFKQWGAWKDGSDFAADAMAVLNDGTVVEPVRPALLAEDRRAPLPPRRPTMMRKVGKRAAGRELDGVTHDAYPEVR